MFGRWLGSSAQSIQSSLCYVHPSEEAVPKRFRAGWPLKLGTAIKSLPSRWLRSMPQAQYSESVARDAPVAQLDRASAF
jgi:hypothetical protein